MVKILMVLSSFHGSVGNAVNERRIAYSLARHSEVEKVYVLTAASLLEFLPRKSCQGIYSKMRIISIPRLPSPAPSIFMFQMVLYGFFLSLLSIFLRLLGLIDIIYVRESWLAYGFVSCRKFLCPVGVKIVSIASSQIFGEAGSWRHKIFKHFASVIDTYVIKTAGVLFTVPGSFSKRLKKIRGTGKGIVELPQPIPIELFSKPHLLEDSLPDFSSSYLVGYVGVITPHASLDNIVRAMAIVQKKLPNSRLLLVGDGDPRYISNINGLMEKLGVKGRILLKVPENEMSKIYNSLCLLALSREQQTSDVLPMTLLEASIIKVPILATKTKAMYQALSASNFTDVVFIENNTPQIWANKIELLLLNSDLRALVASSISDQLKQYVELHRPEIVAEKLICSFK